MKRFLLGVVSTLVVLALALVVVLFSLGSGSGGTAATPSPSTSATAPPKRPADLAADETWLGSVDLRSEDVVSADGDLADVVAKGTGVRFSPKGLRAQRLDVDATVPFATVAAQVGDDTKVFAAGGGLAGIERTVTILGRDVTVKATGTVKADGGQLLIEPETVDLGGPSFVNAAASAVARRLVTIRQPVAGVPKGMALTAVRVTDAGFAARLTGADVTFGP
ncbi:LmeA family phospholipid-binding protein [Oryzobacter telluris]|uniref:LmeA family phospholipid-binding protein n=1 Tax=Oryzobacter telluris TaxID=3149179 RepID=UPI00370D54AC